jgi:Ca-activated chloride channel homolog
MSFQWPWMLLLLLAVPLLAAGYVVLEQRRRRRFAGLGSLRPPGGAPEALRYVPASFVLAGIVLLMVAMARPQAVLAIPREEGTVILAFDVSGSMAADDLRPTRMDAAKAAATAFVQHQPASVVIGVVAFSESGISVQVPTNDQADVLAAIARLRPERGTSLAQGILASLATIAKAEGPQNQGYYTSRSPAPTPQPSPVPPGTHTSAVIVLLSDGENTVRPDPIPAAQEAADRGIRIDTVGIGSPGGTTLQVEGFSVHTQLDEPTLQQIASITDGSYYRADSTDVLVGVYDALDTRLVARDQSIEVTAIVAGLGLLLLLVGGVVSLSWLARLP